MKMFIAVLANKIINFMSQILAKKEGSVIGGYWVLKIFPDILSKVQFPKFIIGITGSSGKTSTTELTYHILTKSGYTVDYNKSGSNAINGITSLILKNTSLKGVYKKDVLLMELDEKYMKEIFKYFSPTHLVITNITRDQPPRNAHPYNIYNEINKVVNDKIHLILNADDPLVKRISLNHNGKVTFYGIDKNSYSANPILNNVDAAYCPMCHSKLKYNFYQYGHIGNYKCENCDFKRGKPDFLAHNIDVKNREIYINKNYVSLPSNFLYSVYFTLAAYSLVSVIGIKNENILNALNIDKLKPKRLNIYSLNNRKWQMLASKNENNLSYKQSIDYIVKDPGYKTIILGFENSSRRYMENDISWLWDIDFEDLNDKKIDKILIIGRFKYDILTRLMYANIDKNKLILIENVNNIISVIKKKTKGTIYSMVCFDMEIILKDLLKKEGHK